MSKSKRRDIPHFETPLIETHCHLDYLDQEHLQQTLQRSREVGIDRIITIAVSADNLDRVLALTRVAPDVWGTQGIHPHEAESFDAAAEAKIREHARDPRIVAVGEIGLDYFYDHADRAVQRQVFARQLAVAVELDLPVVIHTREADDDTRAILGEFAPHLARKGVIHSFTSSIELAEYCLAEGFMLGFNGITTFNRADNVRAVVAATPLGRILLETDSPYLTPVPYRGRPNAPFYLPFVAEQVAAVKQIPVEELLVAVRANSLDLFFP
ncbi:TatD family deoxyribonuclease [Kineobactrum sediminis]|uniref:TatD family deoxyribonuclease n=1 Tax=Kineobactrum sediminis TaxID=1905677 RepID=A0A2N5Y3Y0_9GAMM|nr:TatD family hydrolase [Kineobactrum sediminis]PLW83104.1 TatD family deoxyribonuclease [Kineobactrum sediminis]